MSFAPHSRSRSGALGARYRHGDRETVVMSWPSVPVEIVRAAGLSPVVARGRSAPTPAADRVLEPDLFPNRLRQLVEAALTGRLADVAAVVLPRSSDPDYKCFLYLRELVRRGIAANAAARLAVRSAAVGRRRKHGRTTASERARCPTLPRGALRVGSIERTNLRHEIASANRARAAARRLHALRSDAPRIAGRRRVAAARRVLAARARALRRACECRQQTRSPNRAAARTDRRVLRRRRARRCAGACTLRSKPRARSSSRS